MSNADAFRSLAQDMTRAQAERTKAQGEITKRTAEIKSETNDLLKGFEKSRSETSTQLKSELAKLKAEMKKETADLLRGFDKAHSEMSAQLRFGLSKSNGETKKETADLLKGFGKERSETTTQLKSELAKVRSELAVEEKVRRSEIRSLLEGFRKDSAETAAAWRELVVTMQAKRGVAVAPAPPKVPIVKGDEVPIEEVIPEEKARLENRILNLIRGHPEGIRLTGIAEATGEARVKVGNITRMLVDEEQIRKEGLLYFSV